MLLSLGAAAAAAAAATSRLSFFFFFGPRCSRDYNKDEWWRLGEEYYDGTRQDISGL
jgi:hypothetical protein